MNEILKKIDEEIERVAMNGRFAFDKGSVLFGMEKIRKTILSNQKEHDSCKDCKDEETDGNEEPCRFCKRAYTDEYKK